MSIDEILEKIEDWKRDLFLCECDSSDPNYRRLEYIKVILKKYQKIQEIVRWNNAPSPYYKPDGQLFREICEVLEDGNDD